MKCSYCKTDYLNAFETVKFDGIKHKVYICPCCDKYIFVPLKNKNIK